MKPICCTIVHTLLLSCWSYAVMYKLCCKGKCCVYKVLTMLTSEKCKTLTKCTSVCSVNLVYKLNFSIKPPSYKQFTIFANTSPNRFLLVVKMNFPVFFSRNCLNCTNLWLLTKCFRYRVTIMYPKVHSQTTEIYSSHFKTLLYTKSYRHRSSLFSSRS